MVAEPGTQEAFALLPNLLRHSDLIYSGAEPNGDEGFRHLAKIGIKTVVSVDSAIPNVQLATANQLRYVHIPIGYGEVANVQGKMLAAVARNEEGPFYIHCHHGKHRGPVAAAIVAIASGLMDGTEALDILKVAGTSRKYAGLWDSVESYEPPPNGHPLPELVEIATTNSVAAGMANIDRQFDLLKLCQSAGWTSPSSHPDVSPSQQAILLKESFRELCRAIEKNEDERYLAGMKESEMLATELETALFSTKASVADKTLSLLARQCRECHSAWRD